MFKALFIGNESLVAECVSLWRAAGHQVAAVVTRNAALRDRLSQEGVAVLAPGAPVPEGGYDWLFSIANLSLVPPDFLGAARRGAINFHDGPLPRHAGLNAPVWALLEGESRHGITWHFIEGGIDEGRILLSRSFDIAPDDTALTLNTRAFQAALESFGDLVAQISADVLQPVAQDFSQRSYHARDDRPAAAARLDFTRPAAELARLVRALDHGSYTNPLALPKIVAAGRILAVGSAEEVRGQGAAGEVLALDQTTLTLACAGDRALRLSGLRDLQGEAFRPAETLRSGEILPSLSPAEAAEITAALAAVTPSEGRIRALLRSFAPLGVTQTPPAAAPRWQSLPLPALTEGAIALWACRMAGAEVADLALAHTDIVTAGGYVIPWAPLRLTAPADSDGQSHQAAQAAAVARARQGAGFAADLALRTPGVGAVLMPQVALSQGGPVAGSVITLAPGQFHFDAARLDPAMAQLLADRLGALGAALAAEPARIGAIPGLAGAERDLVLTAWNDTATAYDALTMAQGFEAQVARTPDAVALIHEDQSLSYAALNAMANRLAHLLRGRGVGPGALVGLSLRRSPWLVAGALGILKAGGAYVPMDPSYPADRLALFLEDSGAALVVTDRASLSVLPKGAEVLVVEDLPEAPETNPEGGAGPEDLAYLIYTSGSTGRPKGVMLTHRNVANFFAGMDARIGTTPGTWLAVTSLSFDISVLELFWTLSRGFRLVVMGEEERSLVAGDSSALPALGGGMEFSLYYWGNDDGAGPAKYQLLLDGARFADQHGFTAVWTPERHFHAFGGPYPNPSVTGAAVAAVTKNIAVRAGSCVAPLHHPARIAEEWAVIDNLTNGRAGIAMASGWQPEDFVLRPENTPPANRKALFDSIETVRRLWRGEAVSFPQQSGEMLPVITQPRPVQKELPVWVTTAGNAESWREAGRNGAHVLTHLLGQTLAEVRDKIAIYHQALRESGRDPKDHKVTLMLHTFLAGSTDEARRIAREPMKDYLRSAAGLIKQYAWAFPAFKKPAGVTDPGALDLRDLGEDEMEAILDFAFERYFADSGLFGTVEQALARVAEVQAIGVTEIACLIDYGIAPEVVLEGLRPLASVVARAAGAASGPQAGDYSIAAQIRRHGVTHLQCTPSMARMIAMNEQSRAALGRLSLMMIGGEALPGALVRDLRQAGVGRILNMYGPTETTIWSTTEEASPDEGVVNIGTPIANTQIYVLTEEMEPCAIGVAGELWIGGDGVARGYWQRPDLTEERFKPDPFRAGGRIYRTGDLVRWRADGKLDFLGRADFQVKLRGYRIELGEIEAVLEAAPGVRQAVVLAREDVPGDLRLVAYVTADSWLVPETLLSEAAKQLPAHMVPGQIVKLAAFPLTPNRKVDRKALPAPRAAALRVEAFEAPEAGVQGVIASVWQKVLNVPQVSAQDNFFALGGHSLLAVQAHREIRAALGTTKLSITDIFRFPTLKALADHLGAGQAAAPAAAPAATATATAPAAQTGNSRLDAMLARRALRASRGSSA